MSLDFICTQAITVRSSKGQALQLTSGLDFLSIQAYRRWMEHPSREKVNLATNLAGLKGGVIASPELAESLGLPTLGPRECG